MTIDFTLHIILWLCSIVLPGADATWVLKGEQGPPLALTRTAEGFHLQPPKGVKAPALPVTISGTHVTMGKGDKAGMSTDVTKHIRVKTPLGPNVVKDVMCATAKSKGCFNTVSIGVGKAQMIYVNGEGKSSTLNFQRVGE